MIKEEQMPTIVSLKLKSGIDLLAFYAGEDEDTDGRGKYMILGRPIKVNQVGYVHKNIRTPVFSYVADLYNLYGTSFTEILVSDIAVRDIASPFFANFYLHNVGELLAKEQMIQDQYMNARFQKLVMESLDEMPDRINYMDSDLTVAH